MEKIVIPMPEDLVETIDEKKGDMSREAFVEMCIDHVLGVTGKKELLPWKNTFDRVWLYAFLSYGVGDTLASYIALNRGGTFGDPVLQFLFGENFYPVIPFKIVILLSALLVSYYLIDNKSNSLAFPVILTIAGILFIINNSLYIIGFR